MDSKSLPTTANAVVPTVKAFLEYPDLMQLLIERGMHVVSRSCQPGNFGYSFDAASYEL